MALAPEVLAELRALVGSEPSFEDLQGRYERLGAATAVALEVLNGRLADMIREPAKFSVDGDASWDYSANLKFLRQQIADLDALVVGGPDDLDALVVGGPDDLTVTRMTRDGARR